MPPLLFPLRRRWASGDDETGGVPPFMAGMTPAVPDAPVVADTWLRLRPLAFQLKPVDFGVTVLGSAKLLSGFAILPADQQPIYDTLRVRPLLFALMETHLHGNRGAPPSIWGLLPFPAQSLRISGVTKDSTGAILGGCAVTLFRTYDQAVMQRTLSDLTTGAYEFGPASLDTYFVVAYKAGAPDVAGTTVNTLLGA